MVGEDIEYLYLLLHSKAITYLFKTFYAGGGLGERGYRYKKKFLERLPIPKFSTLSAESQKVIEELYQGKPSFDYPPLSRLLYQLYNFSEEEALYIESGGCWK